MAKKKDVSRTWNVDKYLCPNMEHNPWSPRGPGKHGFMQVGLGNDEKTFEQPETLHVFVGIGSPSRFIYCGKYKLSRVVRLTTDEWASLPEKACRDSICTVVGPG